MSGPGGTETNGSFVLSEQRAVFNRSEDREVVVTFQWDGGARSPSALRHLEEPGRERHLEFRDRLRREGARRFGAYWTLTTCADGRTLKCLTVVDEFTGWLAAAMIETAFIDPGKPWQNGTDEPFNGKFRNECLTLERFRNSLEAQVAIERWRRHYGGGVITMRSART